MTFDIPAYYEGLRGYDVYMGARSTSGLVQNDLTTRYCMRSLYQRIYAGFIPDNPEPWNNRYFKNVLLGLGYIGIINTPQYGVIPQIAQPSGELGLYLQPTKLIVAQPLVQFDGTIGEDCELIMLTPDWQGVTDIVEFYAKRLSLAFTSLDVALVNSRAALMAVAKNKSASETIKALYEKLSAGEPLLIHDKTLKDDSLDGKDESIWTFSMDVKQNYIVTDLLSDIQTLVDSFDREIGIAAIGEKKERMITDEVSQLTADACARSETWFDCLTASYDNVNKLFPDLDLSFTLKYGGEVHTYGESLNAPSESEGKDGDT